MLSVLGGRLVLHVKLVDGAVVNISPIGIADFSEGCRLDAAHGVLKDLVGRWVALERIGEGTTDSSGYTRRIVRVAVSTPAWWPWPTAPTLPRSSRLP